MNKLEVIDGGGQEKPPVNELNALLDKYTCDPDAKPEFLIYGKNHLGRYGVINWIKPCNEQEIMARKISKLINQQGGETRIITRKEYENGANEAPRNIIKNA